MARHDDDVWWQAAKVFLRNTVITGPREALPSELSDADSGDGGGKANEAEAAEAAQPIELGGVSLSSALRAAQAAQPIIILSSEQQNRPGEWSII